MNNPVVTVLLPMYNGERYLREAVDSVLSQTYRDFEFLIVDDGSTDNSTALVETYADPRIRLVRNEKNLGQTLSLNKGIELSRGRYIARMDCDDVCLPQRLETQVRFLDEHPEISAAGCWAKRIGEGEGHVYRYPVEAAEAKCKLLWHPCCAHPAVVIRRDDLLKNKFLYNPEFRYCQDYDLWARMSERLKIANVPEVLLLYRFHEAQMGQTLLREREQEPEKVRLFLLGKLNLAPSSRQRILHNQIADLNVAPTQDWIDQAQRWLDRLKKTNAKARYFPEPEFSRLLDRRWFDLCYASTSLGPWIVWRYIRSLEKRSAGLHPVELGKFLLKSLLRSRNAYQKSLPK